MKLKMTLLFFVYILLCGCTAEYYSGDKLTDTELLKFERIAEIPGVSKDQLFTNANTWIVNNFGSAKSVIDFKDKEAGKIMGKCILTIRDNVYPYRIRNTISIELKDEKVRITFSDPLWKVAGSSYGYTTIEHVKMAKALQAKWWSLSESLINSLSKTSEW